MSGDISDEKDFGTQKIRSIVNGATDLALRSLREKALLTGGRLNFNQVLEHFKDFQASPGEQILDYYHQSWEECGQAVENARFERERKYPFERIVVNSFVHLMPPRGQPAEPGKHLSRRIIPGFIMVLQQLLGPEFYEEYEDACRDLIRRLRATYGDGFSWDVVYNDSTGETIVHDVLVYVSRYFMDMEKRRHWAIEIIEGAMPPPMGEEDWEFGDREFHKLMTALYKPMRDALDTKEGAAELLKRYGKDSCTMLRDMFEVLDVDFVQVISAENNGE